jgi:Phage integrase, N-terminal SAM-like domain
VAILARRRRPANAAGGILVKLLEQVRDALRTKHYSYRTERCYLRWIEQYIRFHRTAEGFRHPGTLGGPEVEHFLTSLAVQRHVSASTQTQALSTLLFLYRDVLRLDLGSLDVLVPPPPLSAPPPYTQPG